MKLLKKGGAFKKMVQMIQENNRKLKPKAGSISVI
jgi:hypothetical protein